MRLAVLLLVVAACGSHAAAPRVVPASRAVDPWKALDPRGDDWEAKLASIPPEQREPMAIALLAAGNFQCATVALRHGCDPPVPAFVGVRPSDDLDAPCLRRRLALWAVEQVDTATLAGELRREALAMVGLMAPEHELNRAVLERLMSADDQELRSEAVLDYAERGNSLDAASVSGLARLTLEQLACDGVDAAMNVLIDQGGLTADDLDEFNAARCEGIARLDSTTLLRVADEAHRLKVSHAGGHGLEFLYTQLIMGGDCRLWATLLAQYPDKALQRAIGVRQWPFRACLALLGPGSASQDIRDLVTQGDLTLRIDTDHVNDDTQDRHYTDHRTNDSTFVMPYADELVQALPGCESTTCRVPGAQITFVLTYDTTGRLSELERDETLGGCD